MIPLLLAAAAAAAPVALAPGQQTTLTVTGDTIVATPPVVGSLARYERLSAERSANEGCTAENCGANAETVRKGDLPIARPVPVKDTVRITFAKVNGGSTLAFDNGFGKIMTYRAEITVRGRTSTTDVCQVVPGLSGIEHWPYPIDRIELSAIRFDDWDGKTAPRCE